MNTPDVSFSANDYTRAFNQTLIMKTNYSTRTIYWHTTLYSVLFFKGFPIGQFNQFAKSFYFPPLGYLSQWRIHHLDLLVAGEAELDKPLPEEGLGHLLQYLDASEIVLNQVVVGGENGGDFFTISCRRNVPFYG